MKKKIILRVLLCILLALSIIYLIKNYLFMDTISYRFDMGEQQKLVQLSVDRNILNEYQSKTRVFTYSGQAPANWQQQFYSIFLNDSDNNATLSRLLRILINISENSGDDLPETVVAFVQNAIGYDFTKSAVDTSHVQYPIETLLLKKGVCSDKSVLLAKLLIMLNYKVVLFLFPKMNHMAVGISVPPRYGSFNTSYCYIETTNLAPIGNIPKVIQGVLFNERPVILNPIVNGEKIFGKISKVYSKYYFLKQKYGKDYLFSSKRERILIKNIKQIGEFIDSLRFLFNRDCQGSLPHGQYKRCSLLKTKINTEVREYNKMVREFNQKRNK